MKEAFIFFEAKKLLRRKNKLFYKKEEFLKKEDFEKKKEPPKFCIELLGKENKKDFWKYFFIKFILEYHYYMRHFMRAEQKSFLNYI